MFKISFCKTVVGATFPYYLALHYCINHSHAPLNRIVDSLASTLRKASLISSTKSGYAVLLSLAHIGTCMNQEGT